ncbi:hypothetical protein DFA_09184 [Cavenderia fasciculata]|uniref:Uncharacterized protein n=1 Tax=Cavenderia fasciculata TaxID=261658 RepID=F4Q6X6_CACFS|nr:uncharacterized protein DFA_09184 [Cavenderia fasciculata]EGG16158.1 hypothetical protein DFA_09184 [Cavenderia fasciculata]|eukprot:XP_004352611.1 hypothetical protein DFA_09184 [Cavenderia fasciculata]
MVDPIAEAMAKEGVEFLWNHIDIVLCSNNQEEYKYLKGHTAKVVSGKKQWFI